MARCERRSQPAWRFGEQTLGLWMRRRPGLWSLQPTDGRRARAGLSDHEETSVEQLDALAAELGERLKVRKETVAVAESSSGGLISAALELLRRGLDD